jgi:hypothetical protein
MAEEWLAARMGSAAEVADDDEPELVVRQAA